MDGNFSTAATKRFPSSRPQAERRQTEAAGESECEAGQTKRQTDTEAEQSPAHRDDGETRRSIIQSSSRVSWNGPGRAAQPRWTNNPVPPLFLYLTVFLPSFSFLLFIISLFRFFLNSNLCIFSP